MHAPFDGLGIEGLADGRRETEAGEVVGSGELGAGLHEHADGCGRGVPDGDLVILENLVPLAGAEPALVDDLGDAVGPGGRHAVRGAGDPSGVGGAPVDVVGVEVEAPLAGEVVLDDSVVAMDGALGLAGGAGRVVHDGVVVAGGGYGAELVGGVAHQLVVIEVAAGEGLGGTTVLIDDDDVLEGRELGDDGFDLLAELGLGDEDPGAAVLHAVAHGVGAEGGEEGADDASGLEGPEDREVDLGDALHEGEDAVALLDAEPSEDVGELVGLAAHVIVGVGLGLAVLALPDHGGLVALAVEDVTVDGLVGEVEAAVGQPVDLALDAGPVEGCTSGFVVAEVGVVAGGGGFGDGLVALHGHGRASPVGSIQGFKRGKCREGMGGAASGARLAAAAGARRECHMPGLRAVARPCRRARPRSEGPGALARR